MKRPVWKTLVVASGLLCLPAQARSQVSGDFGLAGAGTPLFRPAGAVAVIARATSDWVPVPTDPHDMLGAYQFLPPFATDDTEGQLFEVLEAEAGWAVSDSAGFFVAVPWTVGCGCTDEGWNEPVWVSAGDTVIFLLSKTRKRVPWNGPPVFDVLGWHQPYPVGEFIPFWRWTRTEPDHWLSVREFYELLGTLPTEATFHLDPAAALVAVREWVEGVPGRAEAFPIPTILWELGRMEGR